MKIFRKNQAQRFQNGAHCVAFEYPTEDKDINGAAIEISGRYPEKGRAVNRKCKELAFVIKGNGKVVIDGNEQLIEEGDLISIEAGEKFFWMARCACSCLVRQLGTRNSMRWSNRML